MKNKFFSFCVLLFIMLFTSTCKKQNTLEMELAKLPPATQTGQNTFGCLVNGKAWVAQNADCFPYCDPSFKMYYDSDHAGNLLILGIYLNSTIQINQRIGIGIDSISLKNKFDFNLKPNNIGFYFMNSNLQDPCYWINSMDSNTVTFGTVNLTRKDLQSGVIPGNFEFTLYRPGCDTIKVTHGRFDKKL